jgi:hypothetical protein
MAYHSNATVYERLAFRLTSLTFLQNLNGRALILVAPWRSIIHILRPGFVLFPAHSKEIRSYARCILSRPKLTLCLSTQCRRSIQLAISQRRGVCRPPRCVPPRTRQPLIMMGNSCAASMYTVRIVYTASSLFWRTSASMATFWVGLW